LYISFSTLILLVGSFDL